MWAYKHAKKETKGNFREVRPNNKIHQNSQKYTRLKKWVYPPPPTPNPCLISILSASPHFEAVFLKFHNIILSWTTHFKNWSRTPHPYV